MRKNIFIFMTVLVLSILFSGSKASAMTENSKMNTIKNNSIYDIKSANLDEKNQGENINVDAIPKIIASIPEEKIYLYALQEQDPMYQGLVLSINGVNKFFDWETISMASDLPELYYLDLNNDDKKELVVILSEGRGTGSWIRKVHIINCEELTEYKVKNALEIIKDNVETKILSKKEVAIKINDIIYSIKIGTIPNEFLGTNPSEVLKIYYTDYIDYYLIDNKLIVDVGVETESLKYLGYIIIDYSFKDGEFKANKIIFEGNDTVTVTIHKLNKTK
ncbi:hypothetical protein [Tepidibacter aestuarii]|uniref:hypothetical protein n=1 Tax=Tepidibacter aestuarii TaxID=2925782 RepID=UPI0020C0EECD|nr:hypothetical protein [Tepidibacter aestuarii]CAH2214956.1 conserved exported protein of unknown function [Tepidibacter aestuarii]